MNTGTFFNPAEIENPLTSQADPFPSQGPVGAQGGPGTNGVDGAAGSSAFTTTTASFIQPAVAATVVVAVASTAWMAVGQIVFVQNGGHYQVTAIGSSISVTLSNLGYTGNAAPTTVIATAGKVSPSGAQGAADKVYAVLAVSANTVITAAREYVTTDTTAGNINHTLPTAVGNDGRAITFKKNVTANTLTLTPTGGQTIDGAGTYVLAAAARGAVTIISNGANWEIISNY